MLLDRLRYFLGVLLIIPVYPIMYFQARKVKKNIPDLPEAQGLNGSVGEAPGLSVLFMGESSIAGVGVADNGLGIAGQMANELHRLTGTSVDWQIVAKSGYTAYQVKEKLVSKMPEKTFDLVVIGLGGNDTFQVSTPWYWRKSMEALITAVHEKQPEARVVITCMPPVHTFIAFSLLLRFFLGNLTQLFGREMYRLAQTTDYLHYHDYVIAIEDWIGKDPQANSPEDFYSDGVHPSALTYRLWGKDTARFIYSRVLSQTENQRVTRMVTAR